MMKKEYSSAFIRVLNICREENVSRAIFVLSPLMFPFMFLLKLLYIKAFEADYVYIVLCFILSLFGSVLYAKIAVKIITSKYRKIIRYVFKILRNFLLIVFFVLTFFALKIDSSVNLVEFVLKSGVIESTILVIFLFSISFLASYALYYMFKKLSLNLFNINMKTNFMPKIRFTTKCNLLYLFNIFMLLNLAYSDAQYGTDYLRASVNTLLMFNILILFFVIPSDDKYNIETISLNLNFLEIYASRIYSLNYNFKRMKEAKVLRIDFTTMFPSDSTKRNVYIVNHNHLTTNVYDKREKDHIYICLDAKSIDKEVSMLKTVISFISVTDNSEKMYEFDLFLHLENISNELIVTKSEISNYHRRYKNFFRGNNIKDNYNLLQIFHHSYKYNFNNLEENESPILKRVNEDSCKWLLHDGDFGDGKTTLDVLNISDSNMIPVVISPWEDHYDNDILYLMFSRLIKVTKTKYFPLKKSVFIFFIASLITFTPFFSIIFDKGLEYFIDAAYVFDIGPYLESIFVPVFSSEEILMFIIRMIPIVLSMFLSFYIGISLLPSIIIHMKDSSKIHQDYYVKQIERILRKHKAVMVIEDVDRLDKSALSNVFRIISRINKECYYINRYVGILSMNSNSPAVVEEGGYNALTNKTIGATIFEEYDSVSSKRMYFIEYIYLIIGYNLFTDKKLQKENWNSEGIEEVFKAEYPVTYFYLTEINIKCNFRTIHRLIDEIINLTNYTENDLFHIISRLSVEEN